MLEPAKLAAVKNKAMKFAQKPVQKFNRLWTFLCLWALVALTTPQLLWACPMAMDKAASTPERACPCAAKADSQASLQADYQAESHADQSGAMKGCCKKIPLPPSDTSGDDGKIAFYKSRADSISFDTDFSPAWSTPGALSALEFVPLSIEPGAFPPPNSHSLIPQHSPPLHSGRAPPL